MEKSESILIMAWINDFRKNQYIKVKENTMKKRFIILLLMPIMLFSQGFKLDSKFLGVYTGDQKGYTLKDKFGDDQFILSLKNGYKINWKKKTRSLKTFLQKNINQE